MVDLPEPAGPAIAIFMLNHPGDGLCRVVAHEGGVLGARHHLARGEAEGGEAEGGAVAGQDLRRDVGDRDVPEGLERRVEDGAEKAPRESAVRHAGRPALKGEKLREERLGARPEVLEVLRAGRRDGAAALVEVPREGVAELGDLVVGDVLDGAELELHEVLVHLEGDVEALGGGLGYGRATRQRRRPDAVGPPGADGLDGLEALALPPLRELDVLAPREEAAGVRHRLRVPHDQYPVTCCQA